MQGEESTGNSYGYRSQEGDTISCVVDWLNGFIWFGHNGKYIEMALDDEDLKVGDLFFALSLHYKGQTV